jgi:transposase-like protein
MRRSDVNDAVGWLRQQAAEGNPDVLRTLITTFAKALMSAEADAVCGPSTASAATNASTLVTATGLVPTRNLKPASGRTR